MLQALLDPETADKVDPRSYCFRLYVEMETGDARYAFLNTGMWVGSGVRRGREGEWLGAEGGDGWLMGCSCL